MVDIANMTDDEFRANEAQIFAAMESGDDAALAAIGAPATADGTPDVAVPEVAEPETPAEIAPSEEVDLTKPPAEGDAPKPTEVLEGEGEPEAGAEAGTKPADGGAAGEGKGGSDGAATDEGNPETPKTDAGVVVEVTSDADKIASYDKIFGEIRANGKPIRIKNSEEAVRLMQLGLNYGKMTQKMQPSRRAVAMLEQAGLVEDTQTLSLLLDIHRGDTNALRQYLKAKNIDPYDLDLSAENNYKPGSNVVTDQELNFQTALDDTLSLEGGKELVQIIHTSWDGKSKDVLYENPAVLEQVRVAKQSGVYDLISTEVDRRKAIGVIPSTMPFLEAYQVVGTEMSEQASREANSKVSQGAGGGAPAPNTSPAGQPVASAAVVAQRTAAPRPQVVAGDRAKAAANVQANAPVKSAPKNYLEMSDDEFRKHHAQ